MFAVDCRPAGRDDRRVAINTELADFLRSRRAALTPDDVGLPWVADGRRVKGLRRSEVALVAGVSPEYYARLEQGRARHVSEQVLYALAEALRLDDLERRHLVTLAGATVSVAPPGTPRRTLRPAMRQVLEAMDFAPAYVRDANMDVIGGNRMWDLTFADLSCRARGERNTAHWTLLDPTARAVYPDWERVAREVVQTLRVSAAGHQHNPRLAQLVGELTMRCPEFPAWWSEHRLFERTTGVKTVRHAVVGELKLSYEAFALAADPGLTMIVYSAPPGSLSDERLRMLASWGRDPASTARARGVVTDR
jgi:transcriptional regulator with XRE-family HTH domain